MDRYQLIGPAVAGLLLACFLAGCAADTPPTQVSTSEATSSPENIEWTLVRLGEQPVTTSHKQRPPNLKMSSADKRVSGSGGCNRFTGSYTLEGDRLKFGQLAGTMMACLQGMELEQAFHKALGNVAGWRITDQRLQLVDASGKPLAEFARAEPITAPGLGGSAWQLVEFRGGDDKTLTPDDKAKYTIAFNADGNLTTRIDCNRGRGTWKASGPQLELGPLALTRAMCPPGSLHDQIVKQWPYVRSYVIKGGHLFLSLMADGGIYEFEPAANHDSPPP
jgi:heat shock protein HslJ